MISKNELKYIKSLKLKKYRAREQKFIVEGIKNVNELLVSDYEVENVICTQEHSHHFNHPLHIVSKEQLKLASALKTNETCLAVAKIKPFPEDDIDFSDHVIVLDRVADPGNLGTILRSLDWFGFTQVVCSDDCAEFHNPKTIISSMGSFTRINAYYVDLPAFLKNQDVRSYGMMLSGTALNNLHVKEPSIFVLGSESHGIGDNVASLLDEQITISGSGNAESLNVAVATSLLLYQLSNS